MICAMDLISSIPPRELAALHKDILMGKKNLTKVADEILDLCNKHYWAESGELFEPESQGYMTTVMMAVMGQLSHLIKVIVERGE